MSSALQGYLIQNEYEDMNNNDKLIDELMIALSCLMRFVMY